MSDGGLLLHVGDRGTITPRAVLLGTFGAVAINIWVPFCAYSAHSSRLIFSYLPMAALLPFVVLILPANAALKAVAPRWALRPAELVVVFVMGWVASTWPTLGLTGYILTITATPYYFASPENQWTELLHPYLPRWLIPSDATYAMEWFFNGKPAGEPIPWTVWMGPLVWWMLLILAILMVCVGLAVILRKQWVQRERLVYPLAEVPAELVTEDPDGGPLPKFFRDRLFWWGFGIPAFVICWNTVSYWHPFWPQIPLVTQSYPTISFGRDFPSIVVRPNLFVIAFAYLTTLDVLFSVWFFHLAAVVAIGVMNRTGVTIGTPDVWCSSNAATGWVSFGGLTLFVLWGLWISRAHLGDVVRKAVGRGPEVDDRGEIMSYRGAVLAVVVGTLYLAGWLHGVGMALLPMVMFLFGCFIVYLGVAKVIAQCGLVYVRATLTAQSFATHALGSVNFGPASLSGLAVTYGFIADAKPTLMASVVHAVKLQDWIKGGRRGLFWAIVLAVAVGGVSSLVYTLYLGYTHGAYNFGAWEFQSGNIQIITNVVGKMRELAGPDRNRLLCLAIGGVICAWLLFLRYRFPWWPLHPIGFTISGTTWPIRISAFSVFLAWLIKVVVLKIGGNRMYTRSRPLFLGVLVGYVMGVAFSFVVDVIWFPGEGHMVHHW